jgi:transcription initiation factor TFIID subunit 4
MLEILMHYTCFHWLQRVDVEKSRHRFYHLSSDVCSHIMRVNQEAREQWDKKQTEDAEGTKKKNDVSSA